MARPRLRFFHRPARPAPGGLAAAAGLGLALATGQAPLDWWALALLALWALLRLIARAEGAAQAVWIGWLAGAGYFAGALFWIVEPFLVEPGRHGWMAPFALVFMAFGMALFWALAAGLGHWAGRAPAARAGALVLTFSAVELLRGYVLTGFPWALIGHIWIATPVMQAAAFIGPVGLTLLTLLLAALPLMLRPLPGLVTAAALLAALWLWGANVAARPVAARDVPVQVRLVQPNVAQHLKWNWELAPGFFERQLDLTAAPAAEPPDLIVWPETALPWLLEEAEPAVAMMAQAARGADLLFGVQRIEETAEEVLFFNSLAFVDGQGRLRDIYDKHHLVPFGEYVPFGDTLARFGIHGFAARQGAGYSPGPGPRLLDLGAAGQVLPLICYEAVFPQDMRSETRADWVLQITNDAWFGNLSGPYQHLAQARLRAVEQGLPVLRAANTGITAVIDARGQVLEALPLGVAGAIDAPVPGALPATPYSRTGDWPVFLFLLGAGGLLAGLRFRKRH